MTKPIHIMFEIANFIYSEESEKYNLLPIDKLLLMLLAKHHGPKGIYPSTDTLSKELSVSPTYIKRRIIYLEEQGLITIERKLGSYHRYTLTKLSTDQSTTVDHPPQEVIHRPVNCSIATGQLQFQNRSTAVDTISLGSVQIINSERAEPEKRSAQKSAASRPSLSNFEADEKNQKLCLELGLDLAEEILTFRTKHKGKGDLQFEFARWAKASKAYQQKFKKPVEVRSTVQFYQAERQIIRTSPEKAAEYMKNIRSLIKH